jgi:hypothetical protein
MAVIENFDAISVQEQMKFAEALLKTINSERIFSDQTSFELVDIDASDMTGGLSIHIAQTNPIEVERKATWTAADEDDAEYPDPSDIEYDNSSDTDALNAFKTSSTVIDGYKVELEVADVDEEYDPVEVEIEHISHEDAGIGRYEYWGDIGYDSRPYVSVEGVVVTSCDCALYLSVEPVDAFEEPAEGPAETSADKPEPEAE